MPLPCWGNRRARARQLGEMRLVAECSAVFEHPGIVVVLLSQGRYELQQWPHYRQMGAHDHGQALRAPLT